MHESVYICARCERDITFSLKGLAFYEMTHYWTSINVSLSTFASPRGDGNSTKPYIYIHIIAFLQFLENVKFAHAYVRFAKSAFSENSGIQ